MTPERWREVTQIYGAVVSRAPEQRAAVVAELCGADEELRREIESLLESQHGGALLDRPASDHPSLMQMLTIGSQIGVFRIDSLLGVGGMGEVYRARDTKLNRDVAIKILPPAFANDPDRLARFKREAQVLASLNHPNIAAIYGFEDSGSVHALVLELVDGPTLAELLEGFRPSALGSGPDKPQSPKSKAQSQRALPVDEALAIARQIADALEAAHEQGIVHRDLKPANIKVRDDGTVKVLDFGLAKIAEGTGEVGRAGGAGLNTQSPTITTPAMTAAGMILGTAAYMSPEQAKGKPADKRSDIWAFGCVLYEMLTGKRAFDGEDVSDTLAAVLRGQPDWALLPKDVPGPIRTLLQHSLLRDSKQRISDIAVARFLLSEKIETPSIAESERPPFAHPSSRAPLMWITASAVLIAAAAVGSLFLGRPSVSAPPPPVARFSMPLPEGQVFPTPSRSLFTISPDGTQIVYAANNQLFLRSLSDFQARPIPGTEFKDGFITNPVFSPDGRTVAFFTSGDFTLRSVPVTGGTPTTICQNPSVIFGLSWQGDLLFFGDNRNGVRRVSARGGVPEWVVKVAPDEFPDSPQLLPDGKSLLFSIAKGTDLDRWEKANVVVQSLATGSRTVLVEGAAAARYVTSGHLLFARAGVLFAVPMDLTHMRIVGDASPVIEGVQRSISAGSGVAQFSVSDTGTVVYVPGPARTARGRQLFVVDSKGSLTPVPIAIGPYRYPRITSDGKRLALQIDDGQDANVSVYDFGTTSSPRRLTFGGHNRFPVWSGDGKQLAFQSDRDGDQSIYSQRVDGGDGSADRLTKAEQGFSHIPESWSPDGQTLLYAVHKEGGPYALWMISLTTKSPRPVVPEVHSAEPLGSTFSRDGRWIAYSTNERAGGTPSPNRGVYVQPFPPTGEINQLPKERLDFHPVWTANGDLVYVPTVGMFSIVPFHAKPSVTFGRVVRLPIAARHDRVSTDVRDFDLLPDGRLLITLPADEQSSSGDVVPQFRIVLNWFGELKQKVPMP
jgi:eukaryotic-like serine/threonine-protein kinase